MTVSDETGSPRGLAGRVTGILLRPMSEWAVIDAEPASIKGIYTGYAAILAAIPPVATAVGALLFGYGGFFGVSWRPSPSWIIGQAVVTYALTLVGLYILALIIEALAPNFGGTKDRVQAFKVAAYASTALWVAGIFGLLPSVAALAILGALYSLFLLYRGLPVLMKTPPEKAPAYVALVIVAAIVVNVVLAALAGAVLGAVGMNALHANAGAAGTVKIGDAEIDLGKLEAQAKQAEAAAKQMQAQLEGRAGEGGVRALPADTLKALLPGSVAGMARTAVESSSGGLGGIQASNAEATYEGGAGRITLSINDVAAMGGLMGMAGALNVNSSSETANGYEKVTTVNGHMVTERYDRAAQTGEYGMVVAGRFMVQAHGSGVSMQQLKAAVTAVDAGRLQALAKG